jgi:hypothetical protein
MVLSDLLSDTLGRIEEANPPTFWSLTGEVYPQMVYALYEATLISGAVQQNSILITLTANQTYFNIQGASTGYGTGGYGVGGYGGNLVPQGLIAPLRIRSPFPVKKTSLKALDDMIPGWQKETGTKLRAWFPLGVSMFGIYPKLSLDTQVTMDFITSPINQSRPYTGAETVPFQEEYADMIAKYAAAMLRSKEGGAEAEEAATVYESYLGTLKQLSLFQQRVDTLIFSKGYGWKVGVNPKTTT